MELRDIKLSRRGNGWKVEFRTLDLLPDEYKQAALMILSDSCIVREDEEAKLFVFADEQKKEFVVSVTVEADAPSAVEIAMRALERQRESIIDDLKNTIRLFKMISPLILQLIEQQARIVISDILSERR